MKKCVCKSRSTQKNKRYMAQKTTRCCAVPSCGKIQCLHCLSSDPNIRKEWMNFIFKEVPDGICKNLVLCSLHFTADSFTNKTHFDTGFSERLKIKDDAVLNILDLMSHHTSVSNCFYNVVTIALSVITDNLKCICVFNLNHSSVHLGRI